MTPRILIFVGFLGSAVCGALGAGAPAAVPPFPTQPAGGPDALIPPVRACLESAIQYYAAHQSFEADLASETKIESTGIKQEMASSFHLALSRPSSFALTWQSGMMGGSIITDGKTWNTTQPMLHRYTSTVAPSGFADIFKPMNMNLTLAIGGMPLGFETLFGADPMAAFQLGLIKSEDLGTEPVGGTPARHLRLTKLQYTTDFWFSESGAPQLLQARVALDMSGAFAHLTKEQKAKLPAGFNSMKMFRLTTYTNWKIDQPIAATAFDFQPPAGFTRAEAIVPLVSPSLVGRPSPNFTLSDLAGGQVPLASLRGKVVVLDFWATWCGAALPAVAEVTSSFADRNVVFYAVNVKEPADVVQKYQAARFLNFPMLLDADGKVAELYEAKDIPRLVLIDKGGMIQAVHFGYDPDLKTVLAQQINDVLAGKQLAAAPLAH